MKLTPIATAAAAPVPHQDGLFVASYFVKRKAGMSFEDYARHQLEVHVPLALALPGLLDYRYTHFRPGPDGDQPFDGVAQVTFASRAARDAALASEAGQTALADIPNYLDPDAMRVLETTSADIHVSVQA